MTNLLLAEALKLRTTRTMWALLGATVAVSALAVATAVVVGSDTNLDLESARGAREIMNVTANGAIFVLVLGVILSAGEFRMGTATDTFLTTPRRWRVVAAKLVTAGAVGLVFGALAAGVSIGIAGLSYRLEGLTFPLGSSDAWSTVGGSVLYAALFGAIGAATRASSATRWSRSSVGSHGSPLSSTSPPGSRPTSGSGCRWRPEER